MDHCNQSTLSSLLLYDYGEETFQIDEEAAEVDVQVVISTLFKATYLLLIATFAYRFLKWLAEYIRNIRAMNKMAGPFTIPIIGNLHLIKGRQGQPKIFSHFSDFLIASF